MSDRENKAQTQSQSQGGNAGERPGPGTGAGSRQQEQQTAGGTMDTGVNPGDGQPEQSTGQAEREGRTADQMGQQGTYGETQATMDSPGDTTAQHARTVGGRERQMEQGSDADQRRQAEQQGGTYHPAGDRGLEYEAGTGDEIAFDSTQPNETGERDRQPRQEEDSERRRQAEQQGNRPSQPGE